MDLGNLMEPMTLGSPIQSPPKQHHHQQQPGSFLPSFLMGSPTAPSSPALSSHRAMISPTKLHRSSSVPSPSTPQGLSPSLQRGPPLISQHESLGKSHLRSTVEKHGGPPTMSLMGGLTPKRPNSSLLGTPSTPQTPAFNFPSTPKPSLPTSEMPYSPSSWEPLDALDVWVTVFGFPPSASSYVVSEFSQCGTILQTSLPPSANWMHLKFQTRLQAAKALSKNGSVLGGSIMVGVAPVTDASVLDNVNTNATSPVENSRVDQTAGNSLGTPRSNPRVEHSVANVSNSLGTPRSIRPLTQAYKDAQSEYKVLPNTNTPNKESGLVSKAIGAVFGW